MSKEKRISKRLQITLSPESYHALSDFKDETGESISGLIDNIIRESIPSLRALVEAHKRIKSGNESGVTKVKEVLHRASEELSQAILDFDKKTSKKR